MNNNRLRTQNVGQHVLFLHCTRSGGISQPALCSPSGGYGCTRAGLRCGGGHAASRRRECATENNGVSGKNGEFFAKNGGFSWQSGAFFAGGRRARTVPRRERQRPCGKGGNRGEKAAEHGAERHKKSPEDCGMSRSSGRNVGACRRNKRQALRVYAYLFSSVVGALSMRSRN